MTHDQLPKTCQGGVSLSTSGLKMVVEAVTHVLRQNASRNDIQTTHAIVLTDPMNLLQKVKRGMGSPDCVNV